MNIPVQNQQAAEPYHFASEILREYDIRGQVGKNLSIEDAYAVGLSFGTYIRREGGTTACVGYDGRETSPAFADAIAKGLMATGLNVENVGLGPTPMLYFAVKDHKADGGVMITGSHNPSDYNGFKMTLQSRPIFGEAIQELGRIAASADYESGQGSSATIDIQDNYIDRLMKDFTGHKALKVAWDCGNGAAGEIIRRLVKRLPGEHILLFDEIDGSFPNHHPDPTVDKNLQDLIKLVRDEKCDLGVAFDGDGDRIGAVDENGDILRCDNLIAIYAREVLENHPGASIIGDVKCSQVLFNEIKRLGGEPIMWKTGHSLIKSKMAETNSPLSGELSGHIFFADKYYGFDDAPYCAIRLLNELSVNDGTMSGLSAHLPKAFNTPEIRFEVDESEKFELIKRLAASIKTRADTSEFDLNEIDGVRISTAQGWWLIRASNTQNVLAGRVEADSAEALENLKNMLAEEIEKLGYSINFDTQE